MSIELNVDARFWGKQSNDYVVVEVDGSTIGECLNHLAKKQPVIKNGIFDEHSNLRATIFVFINNERIPPDKLARPVKNGDKVNIVNLAGRSCCH